MAAIFGINRRTIKTWVAEGRLPKPIRKLSSKKSYWLADTVNDFLRRLQQDAGERNS
jgi:hypothetical protein